MEGWGAGEQVGELGRHGVSAQQGVPLSVPPPPLAIIAVQAEFEHRVASFDEGKGDSPVLEEEPPPPPIHRYDAIPGAVPPRILHPAEQAPPARPPAPAQHLPTLAYGAPTPFIEPQAPSQP